MRYSFRNKYLQQHNPHKYQNCKSKGKESSLPESLWLYSWLEMRKRNSSQVSWSSRGLSCIQRSTMRETAFWQIMSCPFPAAVMLPDASSALLPPPAGSEHTPSKRKFLLLLILIVPQVQECVCVRQFLFVHLCGCIMQTCVCVCVPCLMIHYCPQVFKRRHYCITFNLNIHK